MQQQITNTGSVFSSSFFLSLLDGSWDHLFVSNVISCKFQIMKFHDSMPSVDIRENF